jgi:methylenetetrahydrofolate--tRNA-(uracil-5-)-methyltransferase
MRIGEQKRVLQTLPGMHKAVFARYGSVHRNTFIRSPALLSPWLEHRERAGLWFAGQIAGVEGYVESTAMGFWAGVAAAFRARGAEAPLPPETTAVGALARWLSRADPKSFQPMNVNFGLLPPLEGALARGSRRERNERISQRALGALEGWRAAIAPERA